MSIAPAKCLRCPNGPPYRTGRADALFPTLVAALVVLSRIPFLSAGYGVDFDAWRVAGAARTIATTHVYTAARLPGNPVHEVVCAMLLPGGHIALNTATALFSGMAAAFFALSVRVLGGKDYALAGLALAFTPVVFISSTATMDYVWALAFTMGSLYFILIGRPLLAGLMLGGAIGCRLTSGAMLIPLGIMLAGRERTAGSSSLCKFVLGACFVAAVAFTPVVLRYGWGFLRFFDNGRPAFVEAARRATEEVWGRVGFLALVAATFSLVFSRRSQPGVTSIPPAQGRGVVAAWLTAIGLYAVAFFRLPIEAGYLIPAVPFVILLVGRLARRRVFIVVCVALLVSPFVGITRTGLGSGPVLLDRESRLARMGFVNRVLATGNILPGRNLVIVGGWLPQIQETLLLRARKDSRVTVTYPTLSPEPSWGNPSATVWQAGHMTRYVLRVDEAQLSGYLDRGFHIYDLPGQTEQTLRANGLDLQAIGIRPLLEDQPAA